MAYDPTIIDARSVVQITLEAATTCLPGTLLGYNSGWVKADADSNPIVPAVLMAMEYGAAGATVKACRAGVLWDRDAPFTAGNDQYLSATAGAFTATPPAASGTLSTVQKIGKALTTEYMAFDLATGLAPLFLQWTGAVDPANIAAAVSSSETAVTITGIKTTDIVASMLNPAALETGVAASGCRISAADTVQLRLSNMTAGALDPASRTWIFGFIRPV